MAATAFLAEGPHAVLSALESGRHRVTDLFVTDAAADREVELLRRAAAADVALTVVTERVLGTLAETVTPQGVVAVVEATPVDLAVALRGARLAVVLHAIADPGNAGAVVRTADAAGAAAVLFTGGSVDPYNGKSVRASAGSIFSVPVVVGVEPASTFDALRAAGLQVATTSLDGADDLDDLLDAGVLAAPTAWVFGNEAHGLPDDVAAAADRRVRIPMHGGAESLNLAAAAAVCLYASARALRRQE